MASPLLTLLAAPVAAYTQTLAWQLLDGADYNAAIRALQPVDPPAVATERPPPRRIQGGPP
jgi:hypothetical protein